MQVDQEDQKVQSGDTEERKSEADDMEVELGDKSKKIYIKTLYFDICIKDGW